MERNWLRDNGLTIALSGLFLVSIVGHALTGWSTYNEEQLQHASERIGLSQYLGSGHFISTVFENWESEFLQMAIFVVLTAYLFQRGSPESKDPDVSPAAAIRFVLSSTFFYRVLRERGLIAIERLMGMLLVMVAVQMLVDGLKTLLRSG